MLRQTLSICNFTSLDIKMDTLIICQSSTKHCANHLMTSIQQLQSTEEEEEEEVEEEEEEKERGEQKEEEEEEVG